MILVRVLVFRVSFKVTKKRIKIFKNKNWIIDTYNFVQKLLIIKSLSDSGIYDNKTEFVEAFY